MITTACLIDTDLLSEVLRGRDPAVVCNAAHYLQLHGRFTLSSMTRYEILRGLFSKRAHSQVQKFRTFCEKSTILPITDDVLDLAAEYWSRARQQGLQPSDPDLMIAATAQIHNLTLVTGNRRHFEWLGELTIVDWRNPVS